MSGRHILIHRCKREDDSEIDDGKPLACTCSGRVCSRDAERLVRQGRARWKKQLKSGGQVIELRAEIVMVGSNWPHARTISAGLIEAAYVEGFQSVQNWIEEYGKKKSEVLDGNSGRTS